MFRCSFLFALLLSGCTTAGHSNAWRVDEGKVSPFPVWSVVEQGEANYVELTHQHCLGESYHLNFPEGFRWGISYQVNARHRHYEANSRNSDDYSHDYYQVEKIISQENVKEGQCFVVEGDFPYFFRQNFSPARFLALFEPNPTKFANIELEKKFGAFLLDENAKWFQAKGCFGPAPDLKITLVEFRYDH
jgi:hypothetical protein